MFSLNKIISIFAKSHITIQESYGIKTGIDVNSLDALTVNFIRSDQHH